MTLAQMLLLDFDAEAEKTRRVLEQVPNDQADWVPHQKSMTLGRIAAHIASLPNLGLAILTTPSTDMSHDTYPRYTFSTAEDAVKYAAGGAGEIRTALSSLSDEHLLGEWTLVYRGRPLAAGPRALLYRTMFFNHLVHHRGQLNVYLRLLNIHVPGIYGPSADEPFGG